MTAWQATVGSPAPHLTITQWRTYAWPVYIQWLMPSGPDDGALQLSAAEDAELVEAVRDGARDAAGELYRRYQAHVTAVLARVMGPDTELPDLVHESFLRAFQSLGNLDHPQALRAWLSRVATFTALDCLRRRRRRRWLVLVPPETVDVSVEPESEEDDLLTRVYAVLEKLPPEERAAFGLRFMGGLEQTELADALGCSVATAKRRVARARQRFERLAQGDPALKRRLEAR